jgi:hypothetical protein
MRPCIAVTGEIPQQPTFGFERLALIGVGIDMYGDICGCDG